jgi:transposase
MERAEAEAIYEQGREAVVAVLLALAAQVEAQDARIAKLTARIEELERRLRRDSHNSSTPPSQDPPGARERKRAPSSGRGQGGQPGHLGHGRSLQPIESVDELIDHWPESCACGRRFGAAERRPVGASARHQVAELPPITIRLTEHRLHRLRCPDCGRTTRAELPPEIAAGAFGPRLEAAIATLSVRNRLSRRQLVELAEELFGCRLASGTIDAILARTAAALDAAYDDLLEDVRAAPAVNLDETGWRLKGKRRTLWGAFTVRAALLRIAPDRHQRELLSLLGEGFAGIGCSDRWWAYNALQPERRQVCWSHLLRDFTAHSEGLAAQKELGEAGLRIAARLFVAWQRFQQDGDRPALKHAIAPLKRDLRRII